MSAAARDSAITGRAVNQVAAASNPTRTTRAPIPGHDASKPGLKAARTKAGRTTTSKAPSARPKKLSHGLLPAAGARLEDAIFNFTTSAARMGSGACCLSSIVNFFRVFPARVRELCRELTLPDGR